ncbi:hypothetical protein LUZ63_020240 [Rhynchospora breviuscula]|uniref:Large ribosomal subunit protein uL18c n=1 Tax=Rhynchospora breviuscula TaxID=2022672 RepID=A0A9Q0BZV6_9POAL|nr:hypothetical protein LUZ63_020240 [Rhynchospora breviuscula]
MSRIGKLPVTIPSGVDVSIEQATVKVKGPKGELAHTVAAPISVVRDEDGTLKVERPDDERESRSLHGLTRTLINNMVLGVTEGFEKKLEIVGVGYRVIAKGPTQLEFQLGYSHPITVDAPEGITFTVENPTHLGVVGIDKQLVGEVAANIRKLRKPEPYKGKGVRYAGEHRRQVRGRKKVSGTAERPRLVVTRSSKHITVQVVDDLVGRTLAYASTMEADLRGSGDDKTAKAKRVGELVAERAKAEGVESVVFDRAGNRYHGRVAALADAAREGGLTF